MELTDADLQTVREWFDAIQDSNPGYLEQPDYRLAKRVYEACGWRVPNSISEKC